MQRKNVEYVLRQYGVLGMFAREVGRWETILMYKMRKEWRLRRR